jgi:hypothetical protein
VVCLYNRSMGLCVLGKVVQTEHTMEFITYLLNRPLTISDADCDVEYPDTQDTKYTLFVYMVKLSCILGDVLRALCSPRARLMSEKGVGLENISKNLEKRIIEWKTSLPPDLNLTDDELARIGRDDIDIALEKKLNNGG